ncbi:hypothetical protein RFI_01020 [Reticulomyxa filosa]|uniref:t-SNARE coiled-coil homology domain-containing protein n=1 Tax=Reticulomyxa filosa TaxID=46433 RepID=X6PCU6_RETFI|nr:hypothetical protein RFI_01020 [Reticulomyxa filosa]|eukprot:ETO36041.1 hypothetical protein RFI_01020 [Reticulomyxa filosa]
MVNFIHFFLIFVILPSNINKKSVVLDRVAEIEERHEGILQIEQGVRDLQEMFNQLALLVDSQQEVLDQIENNVNQTLNYTEKGHKELQKAHEYQKSFRKRQCCLLAILFIAAIVILFMLKIIP